SLFLFTAPPPPDTYTLSLHDAIPISVVAYQHLSRLEGWYRAMDVDDRGYGAPAALLAQLDDFLVDIHPRLIIGLFAEVVNASLGCILQIHLGGARLPTPYRVRRYLCLFTWWTAISPESKWNNWPQPRKLL